MVDLEQRITKLTTSLKILRNKLVYLKSSIRDNEPDADERLANKINESEILKEQLDSLAQEVYGQEKVSITLGNKISTCYGIYRGIIMEIDIINNLKELRDEEEDGIFDKDSFVRGMFPNIEDYQDYLDGD